VSVKTVARSLSMQTVLEVLNESPNHQWARCRANELAVKNLRKFKLREIPLPNYTGIYFVVAGAFVKIGRAANIAQRVNDVQVGSSLQMSLVHTVERPLDSLHISEHIHQVRWARYWFRGEWFRLQGDLLRWLQEQQCAAKRSHDPKD
jgi:hypothetical protein